MVTQPQRAFLRSPLVFTPLPPSSEQPTFPQPPLLRCVPRPCCSSSACTKRNSCGSTWRSLPSTTCSSWSTPTRRRCCLEPTRTQVWRRFSRGVVSWGRWPAAGDRQTARAGRAGLRWQKQEPVGTQNGCLAQPGGVRESVLKEGAAGLEAEDQESEPVMGLQEGPGRFFADHSLSRALGPPAWQTGRPRPPGKGPLT